MSVRNALFVFIFGLAILLATPETVPKPVPKPALKYENVLTPEGYHFSYRTEDSERLENGIIDKSKGESGSITVNGFYGFIGPDQKTYSVNFVADENGYRPSFKFGSTPTVIQKSQESPFVPYIGTALLATLQGGGAG